MNNTILQVSDFENLTSNYYLSTLSNGNYYSSTTLSRLPSIIANVEINLNAMLNGRLYKRYPPGNLQYNGVNGLTPTVEKETLLQCLTECVEYKLITQQYVNLNNTYSGTVNGSNNYQTQNNNVIGLRQDITAKLTVLGLYASILLGDKKPDAVLSAQSHNTIGGLTYGNFEQWASFIQNTKWQFSQSCYFNGGINTTNITANNVTASSVNTSTLNTSTANITTLNSTSTITKLNGVEYTFPTTTLNLAIPWSYSLPDWSFFANNIGDTTTMTSFEVLGGYTIQNPTMVINNTPIPSITVIKCHYQNVNSYTATTLVNQSWYSTSNNSIDINGMLQAVCADNLSWSGNITQEQLTNLGINISIQDADAIEQVVDKVVGKVNIQSIETANSGIVSTTSVIDPLFQEFWTANNNPLYSANTLSLNGSFTFTNFATGTISPIYTSPTSSLNEVYPTNQVVSVINILVDIYATVIILN